MRKPHIVMKWNIYMCSMIVLSSIINNYGCNPTKSHATYLIEHADLDKKTDKQLFMYEVKIVQVFCKITSVNICTRTWLLSEVFFFSCLTVNVFYWWVSKELRNEPPIYKKNEIIAQEAYRKKKTRKVQVNFRILPVMLWFTLTL